MDQKLRLIAELKNSASPEIKRIAKDLNEVRRSQGMEQAEKWFKGFNEATREFGKGGATVGSVLSNIGVGGLTAAASLAGLVQSFRDLAQRTTDLKEIGRQTGLTVDQVNQLQMAGEKLHIDPQKMTAGLETLADKMLDFRRHMGELYGTLNQFDPQFASKLSLDKPEQQIKDIVQWLGHIQDPALQKRWTEAFLGDGGLSRLLTHDGRDFANALADAQAHAAKITPDMQAQAESLYQAVTQFDQSWQNFETSIGPAVFKQLREAVEDFSAAFKEILADIAALKNLTPDAFLKSLDDGFNKSVDHFRDHWKNVFAGKEPVFPGFQSAIPTPFADSPAAPAVPAVPPSKPEPLPAPSASSAVTSAAPSVPVPAPTVAPAPLPRLYRNEDSNALRRNDEAPATNPLLHKSAYIEGEDEGNAPSASPSTGFASAMGDLVRAVATGTKTGFIEAMRELMAQNEVGENAGGGGLINASYESGGVGPQNGYGLRGLNHGAGTPGEGATGVSVDTKLSELNEAQRKQFDEALAKSEGPGVSDRNNNPGNLKFAGQPGATRGEGGFAKFPTREAGMAAMHELMFGSKTYAGPDDRPGDAEIFARRGWVQQPRRQGGIHRRQDQPGWRRRSGIRATLSPLAESLLHANGDQAAAALHSKMTPGEWCADFVNGVLKGSGGKGVNSSMASAFSAWGKEVSKDAIQRGDVLVKDHHVGIATGRVDRFGRIGMISGNSGGTGPGHREVSESMGEPPRHLARPPRRSAEPPR